MGFEDIDWKTIRLDDEQTPVMKAAPEPEQEADPYPTDRTVAKRMLNYGSQPMWLCYLCATPTSTRLKLVEGNESLDTTVPCCLSCGKNHLNLT